MIKFLNHPLSDKRIVVLEYVLVIVTALIPLFFSYPYRINLFLAWEGAFRMANGEIPYRDFGSPVGYGFWILPALFFKVFGPYVYTLIVVQVVINIISGVTFRGLLKIVEVPAPVRLFALLVYCLSYSMFNFWPWYNHFVFVLEIIGLYYLCAEVLKRTEQRSIFRLAVSAFFIALSFMTKQDTGGLAFFIALAILLYDVFFERTYKTVLVFGAAYALWMGLMILPFLQYDFMYWFNLGQFPHNARVDKFDIVSEFFGASEYIKLYLLLVIIILAYTLQQSPNVREQKSYLLFALLVLCMLGQAAVIQVTSYTPQDGNIYFHSFAFAFLAFHFSRFTAFSKVYNLVLVSMLICLWWSGVFWTRFLKEKVEGLLVKRGGEKEHVISKRTYLLSMDTTSYSRSRWVVPDIASFKRVRVPEGTAEGIRQVMSLPVSQKPDLKMLNMSELTSLAFDMGYDLEKGSQYPLWFHKGVAFFDREVKLFCDKVSQKEYDLILFEDIPNVNQFYPYEVRECIKANYTFKFKFLAPRIPEISYIEVYTKE